MAKKVLNEIQDQFWRHLLSSDSENLSLKEIFNETNGLTASKRMSIYSTAYFLRILNALTEDFKELSRHLGPENFKKLVQNYLSEVISNHFSLRYMGARLPDFIAKSDFAKKFPWATELARFEWAKNDLFDGPDHPLVIREDLSKMSQERWPHLRFKLIPNLTLLPTRYRVEEVVEWPEPLLHSKKEVSLQKATLKIWRKEEEIFYATASVHELKMMALVRSGKKFLEICEGMIDESVSNPAEQVFGILSNWIEEHLIQEVY